MAIGSRVNINFPIPGLDQSSKGFRDNFATIKRELEQIQNTTIQLVGAVVSAPYAIGGAGNDAIAITTMLDGGDIILPFPDHAIQFNKGGKLTGDDQLIYDDESKTVGIRTGAVDTSYALDVRGGITTDGLINVYGIGEAAMALSSAFASAKIRMIASDLEIGSTESIRLMTDDTDRLTITADGRVGIGTPMPKAAALHVEGEGADIGYWHCGLPNADTMIRAAIGNMNSTIAWGLEHEVGNWAGGMRIDQDGTVSLHTGEDAGSQLSTTTARISIDNAGLVGIGNRTPEHNLDVNGSARATELRSDTDVYVSKAVIADGDAISVDTAVVSIDQVPMGSYRTARYTVQVTNGTFGSEVVEVTECMITNANGAPHLRVIDTYSTGASLGTLSVSIDVVDPTWMLLNYQGNSAGNSVRLSKTYISS